MTAGQSFLVRLIEGKDERKKRLMPYERSCIVGSVYTHVNKSKLPDQRKSIVRQPVAFTWGQFWPSGRVSGQSNREKETWR